MTEKDDRAALLPGDPSAATQTEALPNSVDAAKRSIAGWLKSVSPVIYDTSQFYCEAWTRINALIAAVRTETVPTWQPIETAPKDGRRVLLFCDRVMGKSRTGHRFNHTQQVNGEAAFRYDGWWLDGFTHPFNQEPFMPTHWMPLPDPPVLGSGTTATQEQADATRRSASAKIIPNDQAGGQ